MAAVALHSFLKYCTDERDAFDAVVLTRYDLRFKASLAGLLGEAGLAGHFGVRFLWHELGNDWRAAWSPTPKDVARADNTTRAAWTALTNKMIASNAKTFAGSRWKLNTRVPDTFHIFGFNYTRCFEAAVHHEMGYTWPPSAVLSEAKQQPGLHANHLNVSLAPLFPWNHWLHKMLPHVAKALGVDSNRNPEWRSARSSAPTLRYLYPGGSWSSNPCAGSACMLNPLYELLPRDKWIIDAGICQAPSDFLYDEASQSLCCPSPDYCCPNTASNCSAPGAILFDASRVPTEALVDGWRRHYYARVGSRGPVSICRPGDWNGGAAHPVCFWAMDAPSVHRVRRVWAAAPPARIQEDDDDTHTWKASGAPAGAMLYDKQAKGGGKAEPPDGAQKIAAKAKKNPFCA